MIRSVGIKTDFGIKLDLLGIKKLVTKCTAYTVCVSVFCSALYFQGKHTYRVNISCFLFKIGILLIKIMLEYANCVNSQMNTCSDG